ncbi:hypothetical protein C2R22_19580 [Salinigranum rubrum]|uniref:Uncharacterized protein n=1 Tax=Salinigranum rubrum TaxID=755307 RepID=A0A2I8VNR8_9EURY|nr:FxLYD domain-containing protein [Salinigranum rubrum]AUV83571.1 hypothetical protein C2R22_19580 [Salinigranum rubrum]
MESSRRRLLKLTGATALGLGVAGCTGESNDTGSAGSAGGDSGTDAIDTTGTATANDAITESEAPETAEPTGTDTATDAGTATGTSAGVEGTVTDESEDALQIVEHEYYQEGDVEGVRGTVENVSERAFTYVEVHLAPKNEREETLDRFQVDSQEAIDSLGPDETWEFDVEIDSEFEFTRYDIWVTGRTSE